MRRPALPQLRLHALRLGLSPAALLVAVLGLAASDVASTLAGSSAVPGGAFDEAAHLFTTALVVWALGRWATRRLMLPALIASVAIDLDHVPGRLGVDWLTAGTPRPYTHSLLTLAAVLAAALIFARRRYLLLGLAAGLAIHFGRDLCENGTGVSLLWPFSYQAFSLPHAAYLGAMAAVVAVDLARCLSPSRRRPARAAPLGARGGSSLRITTHRAS